MVFSRSWQFGFILALVLAIAGTALSQQRKRQPKNPGKRGAPIVGGYVLTHEHPTNLLAFGGNYGFAGDPSNVKNGIMEKGYTKECGGCKVASGCDHGEFKGNLMAALGAVGRDMGDHKSHKGPLHDSFSHERYSTEWVKAAFEPENENRDGKLKLLVAYAVENEAMCEQLYYANKNKGGTGGAGYACSHGDSLESLERQLTAIKAWAQANSSWMEVAYTAADARRIMNSNKLAIVLGIEAEYAFGAEDRTFDPVGRLQRYYDDGVRTFYLAHKINSRLTGADIYWPKDTSPGKAIRATQAISGCFYYDDHVGPFPLKNNLGHNFCANNCGNDYFKGNKLGGLSDACASKLSEISEANMADYVALRGDGDFDGFAIYPLPPGFRGSAGSRMDGKIERNNLSLSHDGERVVREAMTKGMMINIDHVSSRARVEIAKIASDDFGGYPLNAFHNNPNSRLVGNKGALDTAFPHEYDFDDAELDLVKSSGGFFGVRLGPIDAAEYSASGVTKNCPKTATESAKILAFLLDRGLHLGYSLDYATVTQGVHSRTLENCGRDLNNNAPDDFHMYGGGEITEGLTHIGMMRQWHRELAAVGLDDKYLRQLKNDGPEAFVQMWEKSEAQSTVGSQIPRQLFSSPPPNGGGCAQDSECAAGQYCSAGIVGIKTAGCEAKKARGGVCTSQRQCTSDRCSWGVCADPDECRADNDCTAAQFCGDPISGKRACKAEKAHGEACTNANQCASSRCSWGMCADPDECRADADCPSGQRCGDPISGKRSCKAEKARGQACTSASQCASNRCSWGVCADADECRADGDCTSSQYCGDPISGKRSCKAEKARGEVCTGAAQCATNRCSWGVCADADECRSSADCTGGQYCGDPISGKRSCKALKAHGQACTAASQCASDRCAWGMCADADECRSNSDCPSGQRCGDPIGGKASCKPLLEKGKACTKGSQCRSGKCSWATCD